MASSIQYTWGINNLERTLADGIVYTVHYAIDAFDGTYRSGAYGSIGLEAPEEDQAIPYSDLTSDLVVQWTKDKIGEDKVVEIEAALAAQIQQQIAPTTGNGLPWAS